MVHFLFVQALGEGSKTYGIREENGDRAPFAYQGSPVVEDLLGQMRRGIGAGGWRCAPLRDYAFRRGLWLRYQTSPTL